MHRLAFFFSKLETFQVLKYIFYPKLETFQINCYFTLKGSISVNSRISTADHTMIKPGRKRWSRFKRDYELYLFLLPIIILYLVFKYYPMYGVQIAFKDFSPSQGIWGSEWVGFQHFKDFLMLIISGPSSQIRSHLVSFRCCSASRHQSSSPLCSIRCWASPIRNLSRP